MNTSEKNTEQDNLSVQAVSAIEVISITSSQEVVGDNPISPPSVFEDSTNSDNYERRASPEPSADPAVIATEPRVRRRSRSPDGHSVHSSDNSAFVPRATGGSWMQMDVKYRTVNIPVKMNMMGRRNKTLFTWRRY